MNLCFNKQAYLHHKNRKRKFIQILNSTFATYQIIVHIDMGICKYYFTGFYLKIMHLKMHTPLIFQVITNNLFNLI